MGNDVIEQLRGQIQELRDQRDDALANKGVDEGNLTRSYIYVPHKIIYVPHNLNVRFNPFLGSTTKTEGL